MRTNRWDRVNPSALDNILQALNCEIEDQNLEADAGYQAQATPLFKANLATHERGAHYEMRLRRLTLRFYLRPDVSLYEGPRTLLWPMRLRKVARDDLSSAVWRFTPQQTADDELKREVAQFYSRVVDFQNKAADDPASPFDEHECRGVCIEDLAHGVEMTWTDERYGPVSFRINCPDWWSPVREFSKKNGAANVLRRRVPLPSLEHVSVEWCSA